MPTYHYKCEKCSHELEIYQKFEDAPLKKCPGCGKKRLEKVIHIPLVFVRGSTNISVGTYAERNTKKLGGQIQEEQEKMQEKSPKTKKKERPFWRNTDKPDMSLAKLSPEKLEKYIMTGEK